jgi:hypothetical protein
MYCPQIGAHNHNNNASRFEQQHRNVKTTKIFHSGGDSNPRPSLLQSDAMTVVPLRLLQSCLDTTYVWCVAGGLHAG